MRGSTAIVTGGTRGIGAAITERLARQGVHVAAVYRSSSETAEAFARQLRADGLSVSVHQADVGDSAACHRLVDEVVADRGGVDYLVNNAGVLKEAKLVETSDDEWDEMLSTNLSSAFYLARAVWPTMVSGGFGRIVNVGSVVATSGNPVEAAYASAKAGVVGLTRSLALAGARRGITVNCVVPGVFGTDMTASMSEKDRERIAGMIPLGRLGETHEFAHMVLSLLADEASYITGSTLMVDGGLGMGE